MCGEIITTVFGISLGTGFSYPIAENFFLNANVLFNVGLRKIDKKYNNEYEEEDRVGISGTVTSLRSTNYFGLNSNARNVNSTITLGVVYILGGIN